MEDSRRSITEEIEEGIARNGQSAERARQAEAKRQTQIRRAKVEESTRLDQERSVRTHKQHEIAEQVRELAAEAARALVEERVAPRWELRDRSEAQRGFLGRLGLGYLRTPVSHGPNAWILTFDSEIITTRHFGSWNEKESKLMPSGVSKKIRDTGIALTDTGTLWSYKFPLREVLVYDDHSLQAQYNSKHVIRSREIIGVDSVSDDKLAPLAKVAPSHTTSDVLELTGQWRDLLINFAINSDSLAYNPTRRGDHYH